MLRQILAFFLTAPLVSCSPLTDVAMKNPIISYVVTNFNTFWDIVGPGGKLHPAYFLEHKGHLAIEGILLLLILYLFLQNSFKVSPKAERSLTDKEIDELCKEWVPEPLVAPEPADSWSPPVIESENGVYAQISGRKVLNLGSQDFLGFADHPEIKDEGYKAIVKYGVGSCGPRGFYGTVDVHLDLESSLAAFMGTECGIIYSYDIATISSIIPAFAGRQDIIIMDEMCNYAIQSGCVVSRARVYRFKHNDMADLERVLNQVETAERKERKPLCRKYIVVEGIFADSGDLAPLDLIFPIKERFRYRLIVDESVSFGVLGASGRGACEHFGLKPGQVEIVTASMSAALGSAGGFCVGDVTVVEHQRLSGLGYCFSASLPPYLAITASAALRQLGPGGEGTRRREQLLRTSAELHGALAGVPGFRILSKAVSPVQILTLDDSLVAAPGGGCSGVEAGRESGKGKGNMKEGGGSGGMSEERQMELLFRVADLATAEGFLVSPVRHTKLHRPKTPPSLRVNARVGVEPAQVAELARVLGEALREARGQATGGKESSTKA